MSIVGFLLLLLVAGLCGAVAQSLAGYSRGGCLTSIAFGFVGALIGTYLARVTGLPDLLSVDVGGQSFPIVWSVIGAALFTAVLALISRRRR